MRKALIVGILGVFLFAVFSGAAWALEKKFAKEAGNDTAGRAQDTPPPPPSPSPRCPCGEEDVIYPCDGSKSDCYPPGTYDHETLWCRGTGDQRNCMMKAKRCKPC